MLTQYPGAYKSGRYILIDAAANPWMQREYPGDQLLGDNAGTPRSRLGKDPRFVEAMRKAGGRVGDGWGPYEVERNPSQVRIRLLQWNGGTYVNVVRKQGRWTAEYVEEDGEGYEVDGPARWRVSGGSGKWRLSKQR